MNTVLKIIFAIGFALLIGWLVLRTLNADDREQKQSIYTKIAEDKVKALEVKFDSLFVIFDSIVKNKTKVDSMLIVSQNERNYFKHKLYETKKNFNYDSSAVFIKQYLSTQPSYIQ